ncbi:MAG: hypothetical protein IKN48_01720 [Bacteroidaceae bacterium]|nr:hypothetical protein [Bacteroidaceae bacterium]
MSELYWITRLDLITTTLVIIIISLVIVGAIAGIFYFNVRDDAYNKEEVKKLNDYFVKFLKVYITVFIVSALLRIFIPTSNEMLVIYGIGGAIDYIHQNDTAKQLPDKVINALDAYLDNLNKEDE